MRVTIRLGASWRSRVITLKKHAEVFVLVAGDSDFVPAMKFARREGAQLFLVTLGHSVRSEMLEHSDLVLDLCAKEASASVPVVIEIENETTLAGITRLLNQGCAPVAALNFASAKNPGGGFLSGSQAQEESLARSSALYASLTKVMAFYEHHRSQGTPLYTHAMILSPDCPVFAG